MDLDRVRKKVEDGERVSDDELELLRREAQREGSAQARLSVAHALLKKGDAYSALALFEAARRDFPREVQAWLGLARALGALERYSDAERALLDALELNPSDPEALKGL